MNHPNTEHVWYSSPHCNDTVAFMLTIVPDSVSNFLISGYVWRLFHYALSSSKGVWLSNSLVFEWWSEIRTANVCFKVKNILFQIVFLFTSSDHLKTGQKSVRKVNCSDLGVRYSVKSWCSDISGNWLSGNRVTTVLWLKLPGSFERVGGVADDSQEHFLLSVFR